jgi:hypothetical protein
MPNAYGFTHDATNAYGFTHDATNACGCTPDATKYNNIHLWNHE